MVLVAACSGVTGACGGQSAVDEAVPAGAEAATPTATDAATLPDLTVGVADGVPVGSLLQARDLVLDGQQRAVADVVTAAGGGLTAAPGLEGGTAVRFPAYSAKPDGPDAIVRVEPAGGDWMTPRQRDLDFGLDLKVDALSSGTKRDNGDNVLQRGLYVDDAQFKIQLDHHVPSCVIRGTAGRVMTVLPQEVRAGQWYRFTCRRHDDTVTLAVSRLDDQGQATDTRTATASGKIGSLDFSPLTPLSVGGKLGPVGDPAAATDQFNGILANVHLSVGEDSGQR